MIHLNLQPSKKLILFAIFLYGGAAFALLMNTLPCYYKLILFLILLINAPLYFKQLLLQDPFSINALWKANTSFWTLQLQNQDVVHAQLRTNSLITHFLMVLNFKCEPHLKLTAILTPESVGFQDYRKLLVYLYHSKK
jgi:hypothetical protein